MFNAESPLYTLTVAEYTSLQKEILEGIIKENYSVPKGMENELLNVDQACEFLGLAKPTLYTMKSRNTIPAVKRRGKVFFWKSELVKWLNAEGKGVK